MRLSLSGDANMPVVSPMLRHDAERKLFDHVTKGMVKQQNIAIGNAEQSHEGVPLFLLDYASFSITPMQSISVLRCVY